MVTEKMNVHERIKYLRMMQERYRAADREGKAQLLDEMEKMTALHRKYLISRMNSPTIQRRQRHRERTRRYGREVVRAVLMIADTLDWICAERLKPALGKMAQHLERCGELELNGPLLSLLQQISISTIRRIVRAGRPPDALPQVRRGRRPDSLVQTMVPVGVIPWQEPEPGHFEADLVYHVRSGEEGIFICSLQFIDVLSGWSERFAIRGHTFDAMWKALETFQQHCPLPIREIHMDNGPEFMNYALLSYFGEHMVQVALSRGRPGFKNDNRFVEQKNSSLIRAYLGRLYLHTPAHCALLSQVYENMWCYYNLFQPVLRQVSRQVVRGPHGLCRIVRTQDEAATPLERLLRAKPPISRVTADHLQALYRDTNPLQLKRRIHHQIAELARLAQQDERKETIRFQ